MKKLILIILILIPFLVVGQLSEPQWSIDIDKSRSKTILYKHNENGYVSEQEPVGFLMIIDYERSVDRKDTVELIKVMNRMQTLSAMKGTDFLCIYKPYNGGAVQGTYYVLKSMLPVYQTASSGQYYVIKKGWFNKRKYLGFNYNHKTFDGYTVFSDKNKTRYWCWIITPELNLEKFEFPVHVFN
jgi:hypothetical protein